MYGERSFFSFIIIVFYFINLFDIDVIDKTLCEKCRDKIIDFDKHLKAFHSIRKDDGGKLVTNLSKRFSYPYLANVPKASTGIKENIFLRFRVSKASIEIF